MKKVRWSWVLLGGILGEISTIVLIMVLRLMQGQGWQAQLSGFSLAAFFVGVFASLLLFGWWVARKAPAWPIVHGLLVGIVAIVTYELMTIRLSVPRTWQYFVIHALKIVGAAVGGWLTATRRHLRDTVAVP